MSPGSQNLLSSGSHVTYNSIEILSLNWKCGQINVPSKPHFTFLALWVLYATAMFYVFINKIKIITKIQNKQSYVCVKAGNATFHLRLKAGFINVNPVCKHAFVSFVQYQNMTTNSTLNIYP